MLEGPVDLLLFKFFILESTSPAFVGFIMNDSLLGFLKYSNQSKILLICRAYSRKLGQRSILTKKGTFLKKGTPRISPPPIQTFS